MVNPPIDGVMMDIAYLIWHVVMYPLPSSSIPKLVKRIADVSVFFKSLGKRQSTLHPLSFYPQHDKHCQHFSIMLFYGGGGEPEYSSNPMDVRHTSKMHLQNTYNREKTSAHNTLHMPRDTICRSFVYFPCPSVHVLC